MELRRRLAERALGAELDFHLEHEHSGNTRNGHNRKTVHTEHDSMRIAVPRERQGSFQPRLIRPWCRRLQGFGDLVLSLFASGLSMRRIRDQIAAQYGVDVSAEVISKITDEVHEEIREWQGQPLQQVCCLLYPDAVFVRICEDGAVSNKAATKLIHMALRNVECKLKAPPSFWHQARRDDPLEMPVTVVAVPPPSD